VGTEEEGRAFCWQGTFNSHLFEEDSTEDPDLGLPVNNFANRVHIVYRRIISKWKNRLSVYFGI
jgi:hypothetical protein